MKTLILITAFNVEKIIEEVILRLPKKLKESHINAEILIIDDASDDNTLKKIISIRDKYQDYKITCLSNKVNLGYAREPKNWILLCNSKIILTLCSFTSWRWSVCT